jgi:hypothetical protein
MTKEETLKLIFLIKELYPGKNGFADMTKDQLKSTAMSWNAVLADVRFDLAQKALMRHANLSSFAPSIAEIREGIAAITSPEREITADEAWNMVLDAVREYGYARKDKAIAKLPEIVQPMAERWFEEIGMTENESLGVTRGQFMKAWAVHADREETMRKLPESLKPMVTGLAAQLRLQS